MPYTKFLTKKAEHDRLSFSRLFRASLPSFKCKKTNHAPSGLQSPWLRTFNSLSLSATGCFCWLASTTYFSDSQGSCCPCSPRRWWSHRNIFTPERRWPELEAEARVPEPPLKVRILQCLIMWTTVPKCRMEFSSPPYPDGYEPSTSRG
jgi:hypothetical protein